MKLLNTNIKRLYSLNDGERGLVFRGRLAAVGYKGWASPRSHLGSGSGVLDSIVFFSDLDAVDVVDHGCPFRVIWPVKTSNIASYEFNNCTVTVHGDMYQIPGNGIMVEQVGFAFQDYAEHT